MSEQSKHTQGPWSVSEYSDDYYYFGYGIGGNEYKNDVCFYGIHEKSDARLIAAAPELLEAVECALKAVEKYPEHPMTASEVLMRKAIAKANGNSDENIKEK